MAMTSAQYAEQLRALLPPGRALAAEDGSVVANLLGALAIELSRVDANGDTLLEQIFPDATTDFLADWERITGLPDDCAQGTQTDAERRTAVMQKLAANSSPTIDFLVGVAADLGYNITIIERGARRVDTAVCGGYYGTTGWNFVWQIDTPVEQAQTRRAGDPCGGELSHWINPQMPCKIGQHRPAGTLLQLPWPMTDVYAPQFPASPYLWGVNVPLSFDLTAIGGVGPFTYTVDYLPAGLQLNNGVISGTPTSVGISLSHVTSTDANGRTATQTLQWDIVLDPIATIFQQTGAQGAYYDPSDLSALFQDAAGTTPVTAIGQPVALVKDKSGNGNDAKQTTTASSPTLQQDANGFYYLSVDGVDDYYALPDVALPFNPLYCSIMINNWSTGRLVSRARTGDLAGMWSFDHGAGWGEYDDSQTIRVVTYPTAGLNVFSALLSATGMSSYQNGVMQNSLNASFTLDNVPGGNRSLFCEIAGTSIFAPTSADFYGFACIGESITDHQRNAIDSKLATFAGLAL